MEEQPFAVGKSQSFRFRRRPMAVAAELRPDWKIACLLLILHLSSRGGKTSLRRLHILNWAVRSRRTRLQFEEVREGRQPLFGFQFRFEPALARAIDIAVGERFIEWVGGDRIQITAKGKRWISELLKDDSVMEQEREFLTRIGKSITEAVAASMITVEPL